MGVSGTGKTTLGAMIAARLGARFLDADDFHPPANVAKMSAGVPLGDEDRWPWLARLNAELRDCDSRGEDVVLACSALREAYRARLRDGLSRMRTVFLHGSFDLIHDRLLARSHRYMPASLLESQFATLEPPGDAIAVDVARSPEDCVAATCAGLA